MKVRCFKTPNASYTHRCRVFGKIKVMLIRETITRFRNLDISVTIDPQLLPNLDCEDKENTQRIISINLYKLIYAIGTIQTRRFAPSNRMKFLDKSDLIEKIYSNTREFRVKINDIRQNGGVEVLTTISEDFGVGISVVVAEKLFNVKFSTIQRIYGHRKRSDWKCQTNNNQILVVESKGSTSKTTSKNKQEPDALIQKAQETGDIKVASLTIINENTISTNRFLDPPINSNNIDWKMENKILRAGHYSSVFSFLGHSILSKYYSQMRKRLLKSITPNEQNEKNNTYFRLRDVYPNIEFNNKKFTGSFYNINENTYLFVGVDKKLLSYQGFIAFEDYENEIEETKNENHYLLFKDGILIIEIKNIDEFSDIILPNEIKNYQENITISDVDAMTEFSLEKYVNFLLIQNGFETQIEKNIGNLRADIVGLKDGKKYIFELKLYKKKRIFGDELKQLYKYAQIEGIYKTVLITNAKIQDEYDINDEKIVLIGRDQLRLILKNKKKLIEILNKNDPQQ